MVSLEALKKLYKEEGNKMDRGNPNEKRIQNESDKAIFWKLSIKGPSKHQRKIKKEETNIPIIGFTKQDIPQMIRLKSISIAIKLFRFRWYLFNEKIHSLVKQRGHER